MQLKADHFRNQHRKRLAEHSRLRFDSANPPAENAEAVHHRGVRVGAHQRVGVGGDAHPQGHGAHHPGEVFEIHLMADSGIRRNNFEIPERFLAPAQKCVPLDVPLEFKLRVQGERIGLPEAIYLNGMIDYQLGRKQRIDLFGIATHTLDGFAHGGQIHDRRHARKVLQKNAGGHEGDLLLRRTGLPLRQRADVFLMDKPAVLLPQQVLQEDFQGKRQPRYISDALFFERFQAANFKTLRADFERVACVEGISCGLRHAQYPFCALRSLLS